MGWKVGFGAPAALERLGIEAPLVGFITNRTLTTEPVDTSGWLRPVLEPEIAIHLGADLGADADEVAVREAIAGIGPVIEVADVDFDVTDIEEILAGNIFHRALVTGPMHSSHRGALLSDVRAHVEADGEVVGETDEVEGLTGRLVEIAAHVATLLAAHGEKLAAGEIIICGSVVPPVFADAPAHMRFTLEPFPPMEASLVR